MPSALAEARDGGPLRSKNGANSTQHSSGSVRNALGARSWPGWLKCEPFIPQSPHAALRWQRVRLREKQALKCSARTQCSSWDGTTSGSTLCCPGWSRLHRLSSCRDNSKIMNDFRPANSSCPTTRTDASASGPALCAPTHWSHPFPTRGWFWRTPILTYFHPT